MNLDLMCDQCGQRAEFMDIEPATAELMLVVWNREHGNHDWETTKLWDQRVKDENNRYMQHREEED